jgi:hypothetical protein
MFVRFQLLHEQPARHSVAAATHHSKTSISLDLETLKKLVWPMLMPLGF